VDDEKTEEIGGWARKYCYKGWEKSELFVL